MNVSINQPRNESLAMQLGLDDVWTFDHRPLLADVQNLSATHENLPPSEVLWREDVSVEQKLERCGTDHSELFGSGFEDTVMPHGLAADDLVLKSPRVRT